MERSLGINSTVQETCSQQKRAKLGMEESTTASTYRTSVL